MTVEHAVATHYTLGTLEQTFLEALERSGKNPDRLAPDDLAPMDEFHMGGRQATIDFAERFAPERGMHLLDIGCGIGGPSRYFANVHGCRVTGVDLTDEYIQAAESFSRRCGLSDRVAYRRASALALPCPDASFDGAYMLHVGMNIPDKAALCVEVRRVLKPGARFGIYDVMRVGAGELAFPVPWAGDAGVSFLEAPATYRRLLEDAGFEVLHERNRREFALEFFRRVRETMASGGPPQLGIHLHMGANAPEKIGHLIAALEQGLIAPCEVIGRVTP